MITMSIRRAATRSVLYFGAFLPLAYAATIAAVAIHEVLGHGVTAILLGGTLDRVVLRWDGMGYASTRLPENCAPVLQMLQLAGGALATIITGLPIFLIGVLLPSKSAWKLPLVVVGTLIALEGFTYLFFNSVYPRPPGDFGRLLGIWQYTSLPGHAIGRAAMVLLGGAGTLAVMFLASAILHDTIACRLSESARPSLAMSIYVLAGFVILPSVLLSYMFDWNELIVGVGPFPNHVIVALTVVCAIAVLCRQHSKRRGNDNAIGDGEPADGVADSN